jgi:hypothetical protein
MKTPREILLKRHRAASPRLDAVRRKVIASECPANGVQPTAATPSLILRCGLTLWRELVFPCRRAWGGLVAVWVVIVAVSLATHDTAPVMAKAVAPTPDVQQALRAQHQLRAELIGRIERPAADRPRNAPPSPHSARQTTTAIV